MCRFYSHKHKKENGWNALVNTTPSTLCKCWLGSSNEKESWFYLEKILTLVRNRMYESVNLAETYISKIKRKNIEYMFIFLWSQK